MKKSKHEELTTKLEVVRTEEFTTEATEFSKVTHYALPELCSRKGAEKKTENLRAIFGGISQYKSLRSEPFL